MKGMKVMKAMNRMEAMKASSQKRNQASSEKQLVVKTEAMKGMKAMKEPTNSKRGNSSEPSDEPLFHMQMVIDDEEEPAGDPVRRRPAGEVMVKANAECVAGPLQPNAIPPPPDWQLDRRAEASVLAAVRGSSSESEVMVVPAGGSQVRVTSGEPLPDPIAPENTGPGAETEHFPACFAPIFAKAHLPAYPKATAAAAATAAAFADHPPDDLKREDRAHFMEALARHARACVMRADAMDEIYEAERTARHAEDERR